MSSGPENRFIASIHRLLPTTLHWEKMHNQYRGGTADVWYSGWKRDLWVEYKFVDKIPRVGCIIPDCTELQKEWLRDRHAEGRRVYVLVGHPKGGVLFVTPAEWEEGLGVLQSGREMTKQEIVSWLVFQATGVKDAQKTIAVRAKRGQRIQNHSNRISDLRAGKVSHNGKE